jgi:hypothetical protein
MTLRLDNVTKVAGRETHLHPIGMTVDCDRPIPARRKGQAK